MNKIRIHNDKLKDLGVMINLQSNNNDHVESRIKNTLKSYYSLNNLCTTNIQMKTRIKAMLFKTLCRPVLAYGCEPLKINSSHLKKLNTGEHR